MVRQAAWIWGEGVIVLTINVPTTQYEQFAPHVSKMMM
jgi:hypothetical protein